jgi:hypothetical protein
MDPHHFSTPPTRMKHQNGAWREGRRKENHYSFSKKNQLQKSKALVYQIHSVRIKEFKVLLSLLQQVAKKNMLSKVLPSERYTEKISSDRQGHNENKQNHTPATSGT